MRAYLAYGGGKVSELGTVEEGHLEELLTRAELSLAEPDIERQLGVGLCRSDRDFAQVTPVGQGEYLLWSDRIVRKGGFLGFLSPGKPIKPVLKGRAAALEALRTYMRSSREAFEARYG